MLGKGLEALIPPSSRSGDSGQCVPQDEPLTPAEDSKAAVPSTTQAAASVSIREEQEEQKEETTLMFGRPRRNRGRRYPEGSAIFHIEVSKVRPNPQQPRKDFNEESIRELAASIREVGILQPILVTKVHKETAMGTDVEYELIAGERRLLAAKLLCLETIPAIIETIDEERERLEMAVIENLQREDLNPIERARAFSRLQDEFHLTQREIASRLGKSREVIANTLRLLDLPQVIREALEHGIITESHGRLLLSVEDPGAQLTLFDDLLKSSMTTRELKRRVERMKAKTRSPAAEEVRVSPELAMLEEKLSSELGAPVKIEVHGNPPVGGGKITIKFYSEEELKNIVSKLGGEAASYDS